MEFSMDGIEAADLGSLLEQFEEASASSHDACEVAFACENIETSVPELQQNGASQQDQSFGMPLDREIVKSLQEAKRSHCSSPVETPPGTPPPEMIQKIKGSSARKAAIMLPMGLQSRGIRSRGESPAKFTSRKLEKIMKEQSRLETEAYFNSISDHDYCQNFRVSEIRARLYVCQCEEEESNKQSKEEIRTKRAADIKNETRSPVALKDFLDNEKLQKLTECPKNIAVAKKTQLSKSSVGKVLDDIPGDDNENITKPQAHQPVNNPSETHHQSEVLPKGAVLDKNVNQNSGNTRTESNNLTGISPEEKKLMKRSDSSSSLSSSCSRGSRKLYIKKKKHQKGNKASKQTQGSWPSPHDHSSLDLSAGLPELPLFDTKSRDNVSLNSSRNSSRSSTPSIDFEVEDRANKMGLIVPVEAHHGKPKKRAEAVPTFGPMIPNGTRSRSSTPVPIVAPVQSVSSIKVTANKDGEMREVDEEYDDRDDSKVPKERFSRFVGERKCVQQKEATNTPDIKATKSGFSSKIRGQGNRRGRGITATSVKERRSYRKREPSPPNETLFDKLPNYVTVLSQPSKLIRKSDSVKNLVNDSLPERDPSPDRNGPIFDKIPAYYSCFTNSTKYDQQMNPLAIEQGLSNQSSRSTTPHLVIETRENSRATSPDKLSHRSRSSSGSYRSNLSRSSRSGSESRSRSRSPSKYRSSRARGRLSRSTRKRRHSMSSRSSSRSCSRSRSRPPTSRSRSRSYSHSRSRSRSTGRSRHKRRRYDRSRSRSESLERHRRRYREDMAQYREEEKKERMMDRRIVYVGGIADGFTRKELRNLFQGFGEIEETSVHFREQGDNYGFVTFAYRCDAFAAIESHKQDPYLKEYDLCFGGRREFCTADYADLDGDLELEEELYGNGNAGSNLDFEELLHQTKRMLKRKPIP